MPLIIGLYVTDLYATNYWIVRAEFLETNYSIVSSHLYATNYWIAFDGFLCHYLLDCMLRICMPLIIGLYSTDLYATNFWLLCQGFSFH